VTGVLEVLRLGTVTLGGRLPGSSNLAYLAEVTLDDVTVRAVWKPEHGERPLWDFPRGLSRREVAAWEFSEALGWGLVPPTVARRGPGGPGSLQLFLEADPHAHYFTLRTHPAHRERLRALCAFDFLANNADRKAGHCLLAADGRIYAIDNALTFHPEPKLRTVIWDFAGEPIPAGLVADVGRVLAADVPSALRQLLTPEERTALRARAEALLVCPRFPHPQGRASYPWPLL
jgi:uncharacterized repeat protein (TIGR03843 family)